jgi:predicted DsbA family dithiol-disulfide isomerase
MKSAGQSVGIDFTGLTGYPNTLMAHCLLKFVEAEDRKSVV